MNLGGFDYWIDGLPANIIVDTADIDLGAMDYWLDGLPSPILYQMDGEPPEPSGFHPAWARGSNILLGAGAA